MAVPVRSLLVDSVRDYRRAWPQLILTDVLVRSATVVVVTPLLGLLLLLFLSITRTGVLADADILRFLAHPTGAVALLTLLAVSLGLLFAETGQLMVIGFGAVEDRRVTWLEAFRYAWLRVPQLVRLALSAVLRLLPMALPFFAVSGGLYLLLVRKHDISYFLAARPPEFLVAAGLAGLVLALVTAWILVRIAGWLLALPMVLFEGLGGLESLRASDAATRPRRRELTLWLAAWVGVVTLAAGVLSLLVGLLGGVWVSWAGSSPRLLVTGLGVLLALHGLAALALSVGAATFFPLIVVRLYRSLAGPGELNPRLAPRGSLSERPSLRVPGKGILTAC